MDGLEFILPIAVGAIVLTVQFAIRSSSASTWRHTAESLGLVFEPAGFTTGPSMSGHLEGFDVKVEVVRGGGRGTNNDHTRVIVNGGGRVPMEVALANETFWSGLDVMGQEIEIGDKPFDDLVRVRGVESFVLAALSAESRDVVSEYIRVDKGVVKDGDVTCSRAGHERDGNKLEARVRRMVRVADALSIREREVPDRMANNVERDPSSGVRYRNLDYLARFFRRNAATERACEAALGDKSPRVRLLAGVTIGGRGMTTLEELVADPQVPRDVAASAFDVLAQRLPRADLEKRTLEVLRSPNDALVISALDVTAKERFASARPRVMGLLAGRRPPVVAAAARALGVVDDPRTTALLVPLLDHEDDDVKIAACASLGRVGSIDAVEPLLDHAKGLFKNAALKSAARGAIDAIQSRAGGADGGRLSVVEAEDAGALSVAAGEAGSVAVVSGDAQRGGVSIADEEK